MTLTWIQWTVGGAEGLREAWRRGGTGRFRGNKGVKEDRRERRKPGKRRQFKGRNGFCSTCSDPAESAAQPHTVFNRQL